MRPSPIAARLRRLPRRSVAGAAFPVAVGFRARLLGLAWLDRDRAGPGLLIPRCACVHTFGMRFDLDLVFLDRQGRRLASRRAVPPRRVAWQRGAAAVLEIPARQGGEFGGRQDLGVGVAAPTGDRQRRRLRGRRDDA